MNSSDHMDTAPYVERSGLLEVLRTTLNLLKGADPPRLEWTCPVCHGDPQYDAISTAPIEAEAPQDSLPAMSIVCHCGHVHTQRTAVVTVQK